MRKWMLCMILTLGGCGKESSDKKGVCYQADEKEGLEWDIILGDEIGTIYGNYGLYWSTDEDKFFVCVENGCTRM